MRARSNGVGRRLAGLVLGLVLGVGAPLRGAEPAMESLCDPGLLMESASESAYQMREGRCEGIYRQKVNSDDLRVRSFTAWFEDYEYGDAQPLTVTWSVPTDTEEEEVRLQAQALKPETYYRMDTRRPVAPGAWSWPTEYLGSLRLGRADLGILGWASLPLRRDEATGRPIGETEVVYLPLTVRQRETARPEGYRIVLVPGERMTEVVWSLAPNEDGLPGAAIAGGPLGYGYYPARQPTIFTVPEPPEGGLYVLTFEARMRTGGAATRELWFYHPGGSS